MKPPSKEMALYGTTVTTISVVVAYALLHYSRERQQTKNYPKRLTQHPANPPPPSIHPPPLSFPLINRLSEGPLMVPGLPNLGNTCFFNSILQSLASLGPFTDYLQSLHMAESLPFTSSLLHCLADLQPRVGAGGVVDPSRTLALLAQTYPRFKGRQQQDAQECLQVMIELIGNELQKPMMPTALQSLLIEPGLQQEDHTPVPGSPESMEDDQSTDSDASSTTSHRGAYLSSLMSRHRPSRLPSHPLKGLLGTRLQCLHCNDVRVIRNDSFLDISLGLDQHSASSLGDFIRNFTSTELLDEVNCARCTLKHRIESLRQSHKFLVSSMEAGTTDVSVTEELKDTKRELARLEQVEKQAVMLESQIEDIPPVRRTTSKQLLFTRLPKALCFHLGRAFCSNNGYESKHSQHVNFPLRLDMEPYVAFGGGCARAVSADTSSGMFSPTTSLGNLLYDLCAVIVHHGSSGFGHYVTYRKLAPGRWVFISDASTRQVSEAQVLQAQAYMLFYSASDQAESEQAAHNY